jgi:Rrf2 family transcriptional regulator, nitric oxide-sensitive transcriptional repressor
MLMHAALRAPALTTVGEIAKDFGLSATHLNKVAQTLAAHGYLQTVRGRSGGLRLSQKPESIRLGAVAMVTEHDFHIASCMSANGDSCPIYEPCVLRGILSDAANSFIAELNKWTLADLIARRRPLLFAIKSVRDGYPDDAAH